MALTDPIKTTIASFAIDYSPLKGLIGLGSGTTLEAYLSSLAKDFKAGPQKYKHCQFISSSKRTELLAKESGFKITEVSPSLETPISIDLYIDGLDQVDSEGKMLKGKGGALTREKILCDNAAKKLFLCDYSKISKTLNTPLPIEIIPLSYPFIKNRLLKELKIDSILRRGNTSMPFVTDNGNWILDLSYHKTHENWSKIASSLISWAGVVETGFFNPGHYDLIIGYPDQKIEVLKY